MRYQSLPTSHCPVATERSSRGQQGAIPSDQQGEPQSLKALNLNTYVLLFQTLRISLARSADAGIYVCVSSNNVGVAQQAYTLEVLGTFRNLSQPSHRLYALLFSPPEDHTKDRHGGERSAG